MRVRANRTTEVAAVNACRALFESQRCVYQPVALENDYGKDAYVDLTADGMVTGLCIAVQIKGGASYRAAGGYRIPLDQEHWTVWRGSTIPIAGVVHDPDTGLLYWTNISAALQQIRRDPPPSIFVPSKNVLDPPTLRGEFYQDMARFAATQTTGTSLLSLVADSPDDQIAALWDCFALGRRDARVLILMRHLLGMLPRCSLRAAIGVLAHATPHPDIMWGAHNWIPPHVERQVELHFRWSTDELVHLLCAADREEWQRGYLGESIYMLLVADPKIRFKIEMAAVECARRNLLEQADTAMYLAVYWAEDEGRSRFAYLLRRHPDLRNLPDLNLLAETLKHQGRLWLFE